METKSASSGKDYVLESSQTTKANLGTKRLVPKLSSKQRINKDIRTETPDQSKWHAHET